MKDIQQQYISYPPSKKIIKDVWWNPISNLNEKINFTLYLTIPKQANYKNSYCQRNKTS